MQACILGDVGVIGCTSKGISFLSLICPCMICLNKNMQRKWKAIKDKKNALKMIASVFSRRYGSYRMYLEGDSPH